MNKIPNLTAIRDWVLSKLHNHENKEIIDKLSEDQNGNLLFNSQNISSSNGLSAYDIAVKNGFSGTEQEWLESLKGTPGQDGKDGTDGKDADVSSITAASIGAAAANHTHGSMKTITFSTTEPTTVADGEIVMVYEE